MLNRIQFILKREIDGVEADISIIEMEMVVLKKMEANREQELIEKVLEDLREARICLLRSFEKAGELRSSN